MIADIIVDLQYGDCAKGKVAHHLCRTQSYTHVLRYNGGCNAGHTIYHEGKKFVTHHIPAGVFFGVRSVIGPGCVVDPEQFLKEIAELKRGGLSVHDILITRSTHVITPAHKEEDASGGVAGTTKRGNGQAYRDKYARIGVRAESVLELQPYLTDIYNELHDDAVVLCEGAQGFGLDIDWGDYPYVTSSHCTVAGALLNGIPPKAVRDVWGVAKMYETYVGAKQFESDDPVFQKIRDVGEEYGATTGRPRQCNWIDLSLLERAVRVNGVTHLVLSKVDVLRQVGVFKVRTPEDILLFDTEEEMKAFLTDRFVSWGIALGNIFFSEHKDRI